MSKDNIKGLNITGRLKESGITLYVRNGKTIAHSFELPAKAAHAQSIHRTPADAAQHPIVVVAEIFRRAAVPDQTVSLCLFLEPDAPHRGGIPAQIRST